MDTKQKNNNTDLPQPQNRSSFSSVQAPSIELPKGGGAIRGIGEKFAANLVNGSGSMSVPIPVSPGRSSFTPELSLAYDSGSGNGPFGFGWSLSTPEITRKTDKGLPRYQDAADSDVFLLSGAEDLVPLLDGDNRWEQDSDDGAYTIHRYRPRIEGLFARIERWTKKDDGDIHWRSISKENILTLYGFTLDSRIADPDNVKRIFSWLICETRDDKGNAIIYNYKQENDQRVSSDRLNEQNRSKTAQRYLKSIAYGNNISLLDNEGKRPHFLSDLGQAKLKKLKWHFTLLFDYGEGHYKTIETETNNRHKKVAVIEDTDGEWAIRPDPFSSFRAGFEVRTYRRCQRILMFHHFDKEWNEPYLVRALNLNYQDIKSEQQGNIKQELVHSGSTQINSTCVSITQSGYIRVADSQTEYIERSMPPLEFEYSKAEIQETIQALDNRSKENLPIGVDGSDYQWVDLEGEGLSGVLTRQSGSWYYKDNLGNGKLGHLKPLATQPSLFAEASGGERLLDLSGDGQLDVVAFSGGTAGFYERTQDENWAPFRYFKQLPNINWDDPNLRFIDLNGDGHADILITEQDVFTWYPSKAEEGFDPAQRVPKSWDDESAANIVFADGTQSIYFADMSGDGLTDLVRIRNGNICYWPNLGYGRFGKKIQMDDAPIFDYPDRFDQKRIQLADIDGSGSNDIIYLSAEGPKLYFNYSGNAWSEARLIESFPLTNDFTQVTTTDLKGNGTACLVWSSSLSVDSQSPLKYIDLMGNNKPHLLIGTKNNLGAETRVHYVASTQFYLQDKAQGKLWITKIPFPVHVIESVETYDHISQSRFVSRYHYHHGYFDGQEREFRGFGMVEQWDTEEFKSLNKNNHFDGEVDNQNEASYIPPVYTKTWYHTGIYHGRDKVSNFFAGLRDENDKGEYFREPALNDDEAKLLLLEDTILPDNLNFEEEKEACRALKGSMLRQEVYAQDDSDKANIPYSVVEQNFTIAVLQHQHVNKHAVFLTHAREALTFNYERDTSDPRIQHALTLAVDNYGQVEKQLSIGYGRREKIKAIGNSDQVIDIDNPGLQALPQDDDREKQTQNAIIYTQASFTNEINESYDYRVPLPSETNTYELTGFKPEQKQQLFGFNFWDEVLVLEQTPITEIPYEEQANHSDKQKRLVEHSRILYRSDDLKSLLALNQLETKALPGESYQLAFTKEIIEKHYTREGKKLFNNIKDLLAVDRNNLDQSDRGGYVSSQTLKPLFPNADPNSHWWIPSGRVYYDKDINLFNNEITAQTESNKAKDNFYLPRQFTNPFYQSQQIDYDDYNLLPKDSRDAFNNQVSAVYDYRVLQPKIITEPNNNRSFAHYDALGMLVASAVAGKVTENQGDHLNEFEQDLDHLLSNLTISKQQAFYQRPKTQAARLLQNSSSRFIYDLWAYYLNQQAPYSATLARETHVSELTDNNKSKIQISLAYSDGFGRELQQKVQAEQGEVPQRDANDKIIIDADGNPSMGQNNYNQRWVGSGWVIYNNKGKPIKQFEPFFSDTHKLDKDVRIGVSPTLFYDPLQRVIATLHPNHTYEKVVFTPWQQQSWDVNDTIKQDPRNDQDIKGYVGKYFQQPERQNWQTWLQAQGIDPNNPPNDSNGQNPEQDTAVRSLKHANTFTTTYLDTLGRPFLSIADNGDAGKYETRTHLDIEGNQHQVIDAKDRIVMQYDYHLAGPEEDENGEPTNTHLIHQTNMEAGERWFLNDVMGNPIRRWDSRGHSFRTVYDKLRRPIQHYVKGEDSNLPDQRLRNKEILYEKIDYGESLPVQQAVDSNLRGQVYRQYDNAGLITNNAYDFKGNLLTSSRQLTDDYKKLYNRTTDSEQTTWETFTSSNRYDALNRPIEVVSPDQSIYMPTYNEANLLEKVEVKLRGRNRGTVFIKNIEYDAKGQREKIEYGAAASSGQAGVVTEYTYDQKNFRLINLKTTRPAGLNGLANQLFENANLLQDLNYYYDPAGNITAIHDQALRNINYNGETVKPINNYHYDAIYQLIQASGREHIGQNAALPNPPNSNYRDYPFTGTTHANDWRAMREYTEQYNYDAVGNFQTFRHQTQAGNWNRRYSYNEASQIEANKNSNRLTNTRSDPEATGSDITYDLHGNMKKMSHLDAMVWDFKDQLEQVDLKGGGKAYYIYDAGGERIRKVIENQNGQKQKERIYLGGYEVYREFNAANGDTKLKRETLHIMDDQQRIALVETLTRENNNPINQPKSIIRYQLANHLGSASLELDKKGELISYEEYHPYGTTSFQIGRSLAEVSLKRYRYTGKERDEETGFAYHGARYYAPWLGRWTAADPAGFVDGVNVFIYTRNNPLNFVDPFGLSTAKNDESENEQSDEKDAKQNENSEEEGPGFLRVASLASKEQLLKKLAGEIEIQRTLYNAALETLKEDAQAALKKGKKIEEVAEYVVNERNNLKAALRASFSKNTAVLAAIRNLRKYGNELGPLRWMINKTDKEIIDGITKTSKLFNNAPRFLRALSKGMPVASLILGGLNPSPAQIEPTELSYDQKVSIEVARLKYGIPDNVPIDEQGIYKPVLVDNPDLMHAYENDEYYLNYYLINVLGVDMQFTNDRLTWTVPGGRNSIIANMKGTVSNFKSEFRKLFDYRWVFGQLRAFHQ